MATLVYYNTLTGVKTVKPFAKSTDTIPAGHQADPPTLGMTKEQAKSDMTTAFSLGVVTSVRGIVMQCADYDITLLSLSHLKSFVRDIDNVIHSVTEEEYDTIVLEAKAAHFTILSEYWTTIDGL